jgi:hypothetical protein
MIFFCERSEREYPWACVYILGYCKLLLKRFVYKFLRKKEPKACFLHDESILRRSFFCAGVHYTKTNFGVLAFAVAVKTSSILH